MNDLGFAIPEDNKQSMVEISEGRAVAEVQAAYVIAKKFPRNEHESYLSIMEACKRPFLAEQAMYAYPRGKTLVEGPSIRLAEALGQAWGNLDCGVREISQANGMSVAEAYAIDLQTNTRVTKVFQVPHIRDTKNGKIKLTDARDVYEMVANQGARRLRACILAVIPGDVIEAAVDRCKKTILEGNKKPLSERIRDLVVAFDEFGVKVEHIEKRLGHKLDAIIPQELITLGAVYKSLRDGMADRSDFFDIGLIGVDAKANLEELINKKAKATVLGHVDCKKEEDGKQG